MWEGYAGVKLSVDSRCFSILLLLLLLSVPNVKSADGSEFCYLDSFCGPSAWPGVCQTGISQSPINLQISKAKKITKSVTLVLNRDYATPKTFFLRNDGHTVQLYINADGTSPCMVKGKGFLPNEPYTFYQLHFHWGPHNGVGSEHLIDGKSFPLELHMIHKQVANPSKLAVFGILYKISEYDNPALSPIINNLDIVRNFSASPIQAPLRFTINLKDLLPKKVKVFRYQGSLTTPPCSEGLIWTVFDDFQTVSRNQLNALRQMLVGKDQRAITTNYRPVKPAFTNTRKNIYYMKTILPKVVAIKKRKNG